MSCRKGSEQMDKPKEAEDLFEEDLREESLREDNDLPKGYFYGEDGRLRVKKNATYMIAGIFDTFFPSGEASYPCMEEDGDSFLMFTTLFGIIGLHKLKTKQYISFFVYLVTLGFGGFFYVMDVILILLGQYMTVEKTEGGKRQRIFNAPVMDKTKGIMLLFVSIGIAFLVGHVLQGRLLTTLHRFLLWRALMS